MELPWHSHPSRKKYFQKQSKFFTVMYPEFLGKFARSMCGILGALCSHRRKSYHKHDAQENLSKLGKAQQVLIFVMPISRTYASADANKWKTRASLAETLTFGLELGDCHGPLAAFSKDTYHRREGEHRAPELLTGRGSSEPETAAAVARCWEGTPQAM